MSIIIRAGLLYNLAIDDINKIKDKVMRDILYHNHVLRIFTFYSYYYYMLEQYTPEDCPETTGDGYISQLFLNYDNFFIGLFIEKGFSIGQIEYMSSVMYEVLSVPEIMKYNIIYNDWRVSTDNKGIIYERIALNTLRELGLSIDEVKSESSMICNFIEIHGKPDGIITSSPGDIYKPGTLVEIKYKRSNSSKFHQQDVIQMAAYSKIFSSDVLYVKVFDNGNVECELYTEAELNVKFQSRLSYVINNCSKIKKYLNTDDDESRQKLIKLSVHR